MTKDNLKCLLACVDFSYDDIVGHDDVNCSYLTRGCLYIKKDGKIYGGWMTYRDYNDNGDKGIEIVIRWCSNHGNI